MGLPVVDCDGMGRAFPEVQMSTFFINGQPNSPVAITDSSGNVLVATEATSPEALERLMRALTLAMGCFRLYGHATHVRGICHASFNTF
jgi:DUF917 family protein